MGFFPLWKLKGTQPTKTPAIRAVHLEEEGSKEEVGTESKDPDGNKGVTEEFIVCLVRVVKETQKNEKQCYHCKGEDGTREGSPDPSNQGDQAKSTPGRDTQYVGICAQTPFLNPNPFLWWYGVENIAKVRINGESCMAFLDNGMQINMIMPSFVEEHSLDVGPLSDLVGTWVTCVGLGNVLS